MSADTAQSGITAYWDKYADVYDTHQVDRQRQPEVRAAWQRVWSQALPSEPATVLDVGTGSGNVALLVAELGHRVTGIDLSAGMLGEAKRKTTDSANPPTFLFGDAVAPAFDDASFDVITARYVLWTVRDPELALANWRRLLRPGGRLIAVDSTWYPDGVAATGVDTATDRERDFRSAYTDEVLERLPLAESTDIHQSADRLRQAGFDNVTVDELPEILELDRRHGVAPGHRPQMQYRITATV
ncbi:ubiquinone/menaquinone biosynthesis C-methylase UbiE [Stackebrandtia endophytica]|uniref:Ubiquinone/menaquinone biosynthesis C-methylase UbiE n=1 Tax=Stackebrandtia endophytica TaxID=1496996 RepID=A0A543AS65_9ACTN|nr:class I SAM-dependent methyltransferase [Stackebrandtia endophytica]TQL75424.1 ubiquinone/menaquinone biosynthesis C-methylase UbiE [Stackebrandtia endophytica]